LLTIALGRFQFQVFTAFLECRFNGPTLRVSLHDLLRAQCDIGGKEIFVPMCARTIMGIDPADFDQGFPDAVPMTGASDYLNVSGCPSIPGHCEAWPPGGLCDRLLRREQFTAFDTWAPQRCTRSRWRRLIQGSIGIELTDQGQMAAVLTAKPRGLTGAIAGITHKDKMALGEPADEAGEQEPSQMCRRLMARRMGLIPFGGALQSDQGRKSPGPCRERQLDQHRHDDPLMSPPIGRVAMGRPDAITVAALAKHLRARALGDGVIASQEYRADRYDISQ
jgi:hypothetical protein